MKYKIKIFFVLVILISSKARTQNNAVDSLKLALKNAKHDTVKIKIQLELAKQLFNIEPELTKQNVDSAKVLAEKLITKSAEVSIMHNRLNYFLSETYHVLGKYYYDVKSNANEALNYYNKCINIQKSGSDKKGMASTLNNIAVILKNQGKTYEGIAYYNRSLELSLQIGDRNAAGRVYNNLGNIYRYQAKAKEALQNYENAIKLYEQINNKSGIAFVLNNISAIYISQNDLNAALKYSQKGLTLSKEIDDIEAQIQCLNNIGNIYYIMGKYKEALIVTNENLRLSEITKRKLLIADAYSHIGDLNFALGNRAEALSTYYKSLKIYEEGAQPNQGTIMLLTNIATLYENMGDLNMAEKICKRSYDLSLKFDSPRLIMNLSKELKIIYEKKKNFKLALENYELYIQMRDSINNESTRKASIKSQLKYEYEKQAAADSVAHAKESEIKNVELAKQKVEIKAKKNQQYALFGGLILVVVFAGFMYSRFKITQKQKSIIEEQKVIVEQQKLIVEEKQKEVLDSIHYAQRIQMALLPNEKFFLKTLERLKRS